MALRYRHLGHNFLQPDGFANIPISMVLHFVQHVGVLNDLARVAQNIGNCQGTRAAVVPALKYSIQFYSTYLMECSLLP